MLDFTILLCRYVYIFLIVYFIWKGCVYILIEKEVFRRGSEIAIMAQRFVNIMFLLLSFILLASNRETGLINIDAVINGIASIIFISTAAYFSDKIYKNGCPLLWNGVFFILSIGFIMLQRLDPYLLRRQLIFCFAGFVIALLIPVIFKIVPKFEKLEILYMITGFLLLTAIFIPGLGTEKFGASNWLQIGNLSFQPSEFVKLLFIFYLASAFGKSESFCLGNIKSDIKSSKRIIIACIFSAAIICILVYQRDLGGALLFFMTFLVMFHISGGNIKLTLLAILVASGGAVLAYFLFPHVQTRVSAWYNPWIDINNTGYQISQSLFAITTWGALGSGLTRGYSNFIPVVERDMIFAAICEEFGGIFGILLIFVYLLIIYRGVHTAIIHENRLYSILSMGITSLFAFQTFIIIGGTIKFIPLTGITLPLISYGGSSVFISVIMIGILQWLYSKTWDLEFD